MRSVRKLWGSTKGSVAPTVALSLVALIAVGGVAFDYARMASLDTELQQAADQAALAAATQLDGSADSITRATAAAQGLIRNNSLFSNKSGDTQIATASLIFYTSWNSATDTGTVTTDPTKAKVVQVQVADRRANFALTSIVGAARSGNISAQAVAGMGSAICKEPPVMMCNPNSNPATFDITNFAGKGLLLIANNGGPYSPGNFGFLDVGAGASDLAKLMGYGSLNYECVDVTQPTTKPGGMESVINEFNTRFDIYESGDSINCFANSLCAPSLNSRKDVAITHAGPYDKNNCGLLTGAGGNGWRVGSAPYRPVTTTGGKNLDLYTDAIDFMGYPRDKCHAHSLTGDCVARNSTPHDRIGSGAWDIDAYWRVNHPNGTTNGAVDLDPDPSVTRYGYPTSMNNTIMSLTPLPAGVTRSYPTRYQVYKWEMANASVQLPSTGRPSSPALPRDHGQPICRPGLAASTPGATTPDRRIIPVAVVNCTGLSGAKPVNPIDWVDAFLVEPSMGRDNGLTGKNKVDYTQSGDIYVEIVGRTGVGTGGTTNQFVRRDKPYLIK